MEYKRLLIIAAVIMMAAPAAGEYVTAPEGLNVRKAPGLKADILDVLPFAEEVSGEIEKGWMYLEDKNGYVCADYLSLDNPLDGMELLGTWRITAYAYTGSPCANGCYPSAGYTVACNSLDFGTEIYIDGVGFRTVEDRGPASLGSEWCDLYLGDYWECVQWGNQYRRVWMVKNEH